MVSAWWYTAEGTVVFRTIFKQGGKGLVAEGVEEHLV